MSHSREPNQEFHPRHSFGFTLWAVLGRVFLFLIFVCCHCRRTCAASVMPWQPAWRGNVFCRWLFDNIRGSVLCHSQGVSTFTPALQAYSETCGTVSGWERRLGCWTCIFVLPAITENKKLTSLLLNGSACASLVCISFLSNRVSICLKVDLPKDVSVATQACTSLCGAHQRWSPSTDGLFLGQVCHTYAILVPLTPTIVIYCKCRLAVPASKLQVMRYRPPKGRREA